MRRNERSCVRIADRRRTGARTLKSPRAVWPMRAAWRLLRGGSPRRKGAHMWTDRKRLGLTALMVTLAGCGGYQQAGEGTQAVESALMVSTDRLFPDDMLFKGQRLVSAGCLNRVEMQNDGNLVMYNAAGQVTFATSRYHVPDPNISFGCRGDYWIFQSDDNGVLYNRNAASSSDTRWATFATNTEILHVFGYPTFMRVTSDGFFRVSSNTGGADATAWSVGQQQNAAQPAHCPNPSRLTRIRRGWSMSGTPYKTLQINDGYGGL